MDYEENFSFLFRISKGTDYNHSSDCSDNLIFNRNRQTVFRSSNFISASYSYANSDFRFKIKNGKKIS